MVVHISSALLAQIHSLAEAQADEEVCGLLLGDGDTVTQIVAAPNVAENATRHFELDPAVLLAAHRAHRGGGPAIIGHYHSHPTGTPKPSAEDARCAAPDGRIWLIVSQGTAQVWRAMSAGEVHGRFVAETLIATPQEATGGCITP